MTKKLILMVGALGALAFLMAVLSWAQTQVPPAAPKASRLYNPQAAETLVGKVTALKPLNRHDKSPSPIITCGASEQPSPARGEGAVTSAARSASLSG